ncbi:MAG: Holliday junction branch migration protein RuvA [Thermosynechococcus sp. Uc]|uniref:Holliday junction branch migration protein RuvA n=1 Tax=Thermosynechococcus sp. Uc TaxID=3034853 RepID=UPI0019EE7C42|nr:Holliday junction branch migration protein RuvA [Thermosynechococcus sp. Uc]MDM7327507.1 Holliday junction branch migration protein RuvA [Thermosynechococcus sp. Uc]HIK24314.1 Holliday junction branch migration protein RuvA [Thermosynechococcus sp. M46_R2017_013]
MFAYLKGTVVAHQSEGGHRSALILEVNGVGYRLLVTSHLLRQYPPSAEVVQIFTHLSVREDQMLLYGFASAAERDLFLRLIRVNGVGPQMALSLLDTLPLPELVQAIVSGNTRRLSRAPGVGNKTAERIALELKAALSAWRQETGLTTAPCGVPTAALREELELTLLALGYSDREIEAALTAVSQMSSLANSRDPEAWLRETISWLSTNTYTNSI